VELLAALVLGIEMGDFLPHRFKRPIGFECDEVVEKVGGTCSLLAASVITDRGKLDRDLWIEAKEDK
jgi:hypothetical protein